MLNRLPRSAYFCPHPSASVFPPLQRTTGDFQPSSVSAAVATGQRHLPRSSTHCWPQIQIVLVSWCHGVFWRGMTCASSSICPRKGQQKRQHFFCSFICCSKGVVTSPLHDRKQLTINVFSAYILSVLSLAWWTHRKQMMIIKLWKACGLKMFDATQSKSTRLFTRPLATLSSLSLGKTKPSRDRSWFPANQSTW